MPLTSDEVKIGKRIRMVRTDLGVSQNLAARQTGLSRDQFNRVETGRVAARFFPAWNFCQFTDTSPLWLAFGDPDPRFGFILCANDNVPGDALFFEVMRAFGERYRTLRFLTHSSWKEAGSVFSNASSLLDAEVVWLKRNPPRPAEEKKVGRLQIKSYLTRAMEPNTAALPLTWEDLRAELIAKTGPAEAKAALAQDMGVSLAAVSQWRSGANKPGANKLLKILSWVRDLKATSQQKEDARTAAAVRAPKNPTRKDQKQ